MKIRKSIDYAYPTSTYATLLDCEKTGCYFVAVSVLREDGTWSPTEPAHNAEGFIDPKDSDLLAMYIECDGEPAPKQLTF
jgi:hypothetical protein